MVDFSALFNDFPGGWGILLGILFLVLMTNACHEGGHALMAWWNGDRRRALLRRCTLNPIVHFHWLLTLVLPVLALYFFGFVVGGARPVMINAGGIGPLRERRGVGIESRLEKIQVELALGRGGQAGSVVRLGAEHGQAHTEKPTGVTLHGNPAHDRVRSTLSIGG